MPDQVLSGTAERPRRHGALFRVPHSGGEGRRRALRPVRPVLGGLRPPGSECRGQSPSEGPSCGRPAPAAECGGWNTAEFFKTVPPGRCWPRAPAPRAVFSYHLIGDRDRRIGYTHPDSIDMNRSCAALQAVGGALCARRPSFSGPSSLTALPWKTQSRKPRHG